MTDTLQRGGWWFALIVGAQVVATAALAQQSTAQPRQEAPQPTSPQSGRTMSSPQERDALQAVTPQEFASQAAVIGKAEIELGQLALQRSQNAQVRQFAQRIVADHQAVDAQLRRIAAQEKLTLPGTLDAEHQAVKERLSSLSGAQFDREYTREMTKGHEKAVALFESASQAQQLPPDLKQFAASTLPKLEQHQKQAQALQEREGV